MVGNNAHVSAKGLGSMSRFAYTSKDQLKHSISQDIGWLRAYRENPGLERDSYSNLSRAELAEVERNKRKLLRRLNGQPTNRPRRRHIESLPCDLCGEMVGIRYRVDDRKVCATCKG